MSEIIPFPRKDGSKLESSPSPARKSFVKVVRNILVQVADILLSVVVVIGLILFKPISWIFGFDILIQFARMLILWDTPGEHAGWVFTLHLMLFVGFILLTMNYKPRFMRD